eukprot:TRINITY_DN19065_c0_g1_i4.p2 TRINITY_DN19065_c0_g1~~TRINITY_DN19065_c0_g1_i4.p2  ORF type:complete len:176 (-),score=32.57 TRINITY_DN19065_c0_g1_i4:532-1059(-)
MAGGGGMGSALCTLMLKNLPSRLQRDDVVSAINELGFEGTHDFFHMPRHVPHGNRSQCMGYAFINFKSSAVAQAFVEAASKGLLKFRTRVAIVIPANIQGLENLKEHFAGKKVMKRHAAAMFPDKFGGVPARAQPQQSRAAAPLDSLQGGCPATMLAAVRRSPIRWSDVVDDHCE